MEAKGDPAGNRWPTLAEVFHPWEWSGESRRDCKPHRARLLLLLARASLLAGALSFLCLPFGIIGLPLGLVTRAMARRDLDLISAGEMDHRGYKLTEKARSDSHASVILSLLPFSFWFLVILVVLTLRVIWPHL
jgi:hypothetical protein